MSASSSASLVAEILPDLRPAPLGAFGRFRLVSATLVPVEAREAVLAKLGSTLGVAPARLPADFTVGRLKMSLAESTPLSWSTDRRA